jgi:glycerophosphoryl diester phosphodiesterase
MEIIAHRGAPREFPENSLPGFSRALDAGVQGIELDVHLTADGVAVVHHDPVLRARPERPSEPRRKIADLAATELARWPLVPGVPIPRLADVLELVGRRAVVYVEVKASAAVEEVVRCIAASSTTCAVHGFDHRVALEVAQLRSRTEDPALAPGRARITTGILLASYLIDPAGALIAARARDYWQQWDLIDDELVALIHGAGGRVIAWTVNEPADAERLGAMGVDAICTDVLMGR